MKTRNGKIARLPKKIRDELNRRLEDGCPAVKLAQWLNQLPAVKKVLREQFKSQPISEQNLSHWREGGYADWLHHQETHAQLQWMVERSKEVELDEQGTFLEEHLARVVTAELARQVQTLAGIQDPKERWKQFREISQELWRLRNATTYGEGVRLGWQRWERNVEQEAESIAKTPPPQPLVRLESQEDYLEKLMDSLHRPDLRAWVRTDWPDRETELRALKEIYHLQPDSKDTPFHPAQRSRDGIRRSAIYNYPESK